MISPRKRSSRDITPGTPQPPAKHQVSHFYSLPAARLPRRPVSFEGLGSTSRILFPEPPSAHKRSESAAEARAHIMTVARRPSEQESDEAFRRFVGGGKLIGTSSNEPWPLELWRRIRAPFDASPHLDTCFIPGSAFSMELVMTLNRVSDQWTTFQPVQFSFVEIPWAHYNLTLSQDPPEKLPDLRTLLITVDYTPTPTWPGTKKTIEAVDEVLKKHGILDLVIEIRSATIRRFSSDSDSESDPPQNTTSIPEVVSASPTGRAFEYKLVDQIYSKDHVNYSAYLGAQILPRYKDGFGTRGLYLRLPSGEIVEQTCRHVSMALEHDKLNQLVDETTTPRAQMMQPTYTTIKDDLTELESRIPLLEKRQQRYVVPMAKLKVEIEVADSEQKHALEAQLVVFNEKSAKRADQITKAAERIQYLHDLIATGDDARVYGQVLFAPPYEVAHRGQFFIRDWTLNQLLPPVFPTTQPQNRVLMPKGYLDECGTLDNLELADLSGDEMGSYDIACILSGLVLEGTISTDELRARDKDPKSRRLVGKYGAKTGLTFGFCEPYQATTRYERLVDQTTNNLSAEEKHEIKTQGIWEYVIINALDTTKRFSEPSDSGAAVWTLDGRVAGVMTGGFEEEKYGGVDVTYMTPIDSLLKDMSLHGFDVTLA